MANRYWVRRRSWVLVLALHPAHRDMKSRRQHGGKALSRPGSSPHSIVVTSVGLVSARSSQLNQWDLPSSTLTDRKISTSRGNASEHHRKLRGASKMIFLIGLGVLTFQGFATPAMLTSDCTDVLGPEESFTFVPPTTTCRLPRLPAANP